MSYREFAPPHHLREHVVCIWHRAGRTSSQTTERLVLPDGCMDIIWVNEQPPFIVGPMIKPIRSEMPLNATVVGIRFQPGVAPALLGVSARELLQENVALRDVWPNHRYLPWADVVSGKNIASALTMIAAVIAERRESLDQTDMFVREAARWLAYHPHEDLRGLSQLSGMSERQMRRRFDEAIGYGPKKLQRILRMQRVLWLAGQMRADQRSLAELALIAGYTDQPHMTREVMALSGATPGQLLGNAPSSAVSDLFKTAGS